MPSVNLSNILDSVANLTGARRKQRDTRSLATHALQIGEEVPILTAQQRKMKAAPTCTGLCNYCEPQHNSKLCVGSDGIQVCERCGIHHSQFASDEAETRCFSADDQATNNAKKRTEFYGDVERKHLVHIDHSEIGRAVNDISTEALRRANNRLNQTAVWFPFLRDEIPGGFWLTAGEVMTARRALRAACVQWAIESAAVPSPPEDTSSDSTPKNPDVEGVEDENVGSPVFWAIAMTLQMVSDRPNGYAMPTYELCDLVSLEGLHAYLSNFKGNALVTDESDFTKTRARGIGSVGQRSTETIKRRFARWDALGDAEKRATKMNTLNSLLERSGVWDGNGFSESVVNIEKPKLLVQFQSKRIGTHRCYTAPAAPLTVSRTRCVETDTSEERPRKRAAERHAEEAETVYEQVADGYDGYDGYDGNDGNDGTLNDYNLVDTGSVAGSDDNSDNASAAPSYTTSEVTSEAIPQDIDLDEDTWEVEIDRELTAHNRKSTTQNCKIPPSYTASSVKHLTLREMLASRNYELYGSTFMDEWRGEVAHHKESIRTEMVKKKQLDTMLAISKASREARELKEVSDAANAKERKEFDKLIQQGVMAENIWKSGKGGCYVLPTEDLNPSSVQVVVVRPITLTGTKRGLETAENLDAVPENDYELKCCFCNTSRTLKGGVLRHQPDQLFRCMHINERCKRRK